jgi:fatty-acid peroxygenase
MTPESLTQLLDLVTAHWRAYIPRWEKMDRIVLFNEVSEILCRAVCKWVGVPLKPSDVKRRTKEFVALIEGAGAVGVRHVQGRLVRNSAEGWIEALIQDIRDRKQNGPPGSPLQLIANHRELNGELLNKHVAAVEVINLLRPTVAVARFITFAALALHDHPECRPRLAAQDDAYAELFAHEVRRFYPFFPFATARVRRDFDWQGYHLPKGTRTLLDLYGTDHDPRLWDAPERFRPERFLTWDHSPFNFIPQGGGTHHAHHRCAGERITIELIKLAATLLTTSMQYTVPPQDLHFSLSQMPSIPKSRFILTNVHPTPQLTTNH